jgi:hypothetical protein
VASAWGNSWGSAWGSSWGAISGSTFQIDYIVNSQATDGVTNKELCQRTGFQQLPSWHPDTQFMRDGYGEYVRRKSRDDIHPQDYVQSRGNDKQYGPQNPEDYNNFIAVSVSAEDL